MAGSRFCAALVLAGCGGETPSTPTVEVGADAVDTGSDVLVDAEPDENVTALEGCDLLFDPGFTFQVDRDGEPTQIHADAVFDGEHIVSVYVSRSTTGENFDVWLAQATCGATTRGSPILVIDSRWGNATEPQIARGLDGNLLLVWQLDDGSGSDNLSIWTRLYAPDLAPLNDAHRVELSREGTPSSGNAWMPALEATLTGFVLAGAWAHPEAERFQVFVQELDSVGGPIGDAVDPEFEPMVGQMFPALAVGPVDVAVAWERTPDEGAVELRGARVSLADRAVSELTTFAEGRGAAVAYFDGGYAWAGSVSDQIVVWRDDQETSLSSTGVDVAPVLVPHARNGRLGVVWYRIQSGIRNDIFLHDLPSDVGEWSNAVGTQVSLDEPAAPYSPVMIEAGDGWFLAWSSGRSPDFRVLGRFED